MYHPYCVFLLQVYFKGLNCGASIYRSSYKFEIRSSNLWLKYLKNVFKSGSAWFNIVLCLFWLKLARTGVKKSVALVLFILHFSPQNIYDINLSSFWTILLCLHIYFTLKNSKLTALFIIILDSVLYVPTISLNII